MFPVKKAGVPFQHGQVQDLGQPLSFFHFKGRLSADAAAEGRVGHVHCFGQVTHFKSAVADVGADEPGICHGAFTPFRVLWFM